MNLARPDLVPWLALALVPLILHLIASRRRRIHILPTARFLLDSRQTSRLPRSVRYWLLLAVRTVAALVVVTIFLSPMEPAKLGASSGAQRALVVIVDCSASMAAASGGISSMERAKRLASQILRSARPDDQCNLIAASALPKVVRSRTEPGVRDLLSELNRLKPLDSTCDVPAAVAAALAQLEGSGAKVMDLCLVSDFQRSDWADASLGSLPSRINVISVDASPHQFANAGLTAIRTVPEKPLAGEAYSVVVAVFNSSSSPWTSAVQLLRDTRPEGTQQVVAPPFSSAEVSFALSSSPSRESLLEARISRDALAADNVRRRVVRAGEPRRVLLITDESDSSPKSGAFYLVRALDPSRNGSHGVRILVKRPMDTGPEEIRRADAVVVTGASMMPANLPSQIVERARSGGLVVLFCSGARFAQQARAYSRALGRTDPLPMSPISYVDVRARGRGYVTVGEARFESTALRAFRDTGASDFGSLRVFRYWTTEEPDGRAEVLMKLTDGTPAVVRRAVGSGSIVMLNLDPATNASQLAQRMEFAPLMHAILDQSEGSGDADSESYSGGQLTLPTSGSPQGVQLVGPDGEVVEGERQVDGGSVTLDRTPLAGEYRAERRGHTVGRAVANLDPSESDLRAIAPSALEGRAADTRAAGSLVASGAAGLDALIRPKPLWPYAALAAMILLCLESWLAGRHMASVPAKDAYH